MTLGNIQSWYHEALNYLEDVIVILDLSGAVRELNRSAAVLFGGDPQQVIGLPLWNLPAWKMDPHLSAVFQNAINLGSQGLTVTEDVELNQRSYQIRIQPMNAPNGAPLGFLLHGQDQTSQKEMDAALSARDQLLATVVQGAPIVLFVIDMSGEVILSAGKGSQSIRKLLPDSVGRNVFDLYADFPTVIQNIRRAMKGEKFDDQIQIESLFFQTHYRPLQDAAGNIVGVIGISTDTTEQWQAQEALNHSLARFETIFNSLGLGIVLKDLSGHMTSCNPAFERFIGYSSDELRSMSYLDITYHEDQNDSARNYHNIIDGQLDSYVLEKRYLHRDGRVIWGRMTATLMRNANQQPLFVIGVVEDITARKKMEADLAEVQRRLIQFREDERLHLAQDLHDGPLQDLVGITFVLQSLKSSGISQETGAGIDQALYEMKSVGEKVRAICSDLRPPALAPFGLEKAIRSHADRFGNAHPELNLNLELMSDRQKLSEEVRLAFYRIYQEALNNIVRHSQAKNIWIRLNLMDQLAILEVEDNGKGFNFPKQRVTLARQGHLGLVGAAERAEAVGGRLEIETQQGKGTLIRASIPYQYDV